MRKSKFSESQIVEILKDAESVSDVKRLRELEAENAKLSPLTSYEPT